MPTNPSGGATIVVIEMESGWVYAKIADPKPERIEFFQRRTIDDWFSTRPKVLIDKVSRRQHFMPVKLKTSSAPC